MVKRLTNPFRDAPLPLGSVITAAGQRLSARLDRELAAAGFSDVRAAHASIFMAIDPEGTRLTRLADRTHMTKQAAGELTRYLVSKGYLSVITDPDDRRAKLLQLTDRGWAVIEIGQNVIAEFDAWLDGVVGAQQVARLRETLHKIIESDGASGPA